MIRHLCPRCGDDITALIAALRSAQARQAAQARIKAQSPKVRSANARKAARARWGAKRGA